MGSSRGIVCLIPQFIDSLPDVVPHPDPLPDSHRDPHQSPQATRIRKLAEACLRFTPTLAIRGGEVVFLNVEKSLSLFSEKTLEMRVSLLARRLGFSVKVTFAETATFALVGAYFPQFQKTGDFSTLPLEALVYFLSPFERDFDVERKVLSWIPLFQHLGMRTVKDFLAVPSRSLGSRFGKEAVFIGAVARQEISPPWQEFKPPVRIEESIELQDDDLEGTEVQLEPLLFALKTLVDRALCRLRGFGKRASQVQITLQLVNWSTVKNPKRIWEISLPVPQGSHAGLMPILREYLSYRLSMEPLSAPARALHFLILESVPGHASQRDFFSSKELEKENWDQLLGRLLSQLGQDHVFYASPVDRYRPEESWVRTLSLKSETSSQVKPYFVRPSRILKTPEPITLQPSRIVSSRGDLWKVLAWEGPERVSTEWWKEPSIVRVDRDYYRVATEALRGARGRIGTGGATRGTAGEEAAGRAGGAQEHLWIFLDRSLDPVQAFLHGYFD